MGLSEGVRVSVNQAMHDAYSSIYIYQKRLDPIVKMDQILTILSLCVPIVLMCAVIFSHLPILENTVATFVVSNVLSPVATLLLLVFSIIKLVRKWDDKIAFYNRGISENIQLKTDAQLLLNNNESGDEKASFLLAIASRVEDSDTRNLGNIGEDERREAYKDALKKSSDSNVVCPNCHQSPWQFMPGSCQLCGNDPNQEGGK